MATEANRVPPTETTPEAHTSATATATGTGTGTATRYLVALDGSEHGSKAFETATKLASPGDVLFLTTVVSKSSKEDSRSRLREQATTLLSKYCDRAKELGYHYEPVILEGDARELLCQAVEDRSINVLVVGTRGLGTIKRMFLGSVSNYCVQHASCDVIVAK